MTDEKAKADGKSMHRTDDDVDAFLDGCESAESLRAVDGVVRGAAAGISRTLWRGVFWGGTEQAIVGYGAITQPRPRGRTVDWFLIGLAEQKNHLSLYVNAAEDGAYLVRRYADRLGRVKVGSAQIGFRSAADLDLDVLSELVARAVELTPDLDAPRPG